MSSNSPWVPEPIPPVGYLSRKALPIKRGDAEALTREDVQFDLLHHIFSDPKAVFTPHAPRTTTKVTFKDLYVNALYRSSKCSKVLKEKMIETPDFAVELGKFSLLTNVGRINTTMAFFPEMKTALRTYHPVPCLQKTDGNAQDAPRIKNCLKAALLPSETKIVPPSNPEEILEKSRTGQRPPTSVVNLIFVLANHAGPLSEVHFDGQFNFLDLFLPKAFSSSDRARAFLWLIFHYLEAPGIPNPFDDSYSRQTPPKAPHIRPLTRSQMSRENQDTVEEIEWGKKMTAERHAFLTKLVTSGDTDKKPKAPYFVPDTTYAQETTEASTSSHGRNRSQRRENHKPEDGTFMFYVPGNDDETPAKNFKSVNHIDLSRVPPPKETSPPRPSSSKPPVRRSMLQQAWISATTSDPLDDSGDEHSDEHVSIDYTRRINILSRIRGRPPTPDYTQNYQTRTPHGAR